MARDIPVPSEFEFGVENKLIATREFKFLPPNSVSDALPEPRLTFILSFLALKTPKNGRKTFKNGMIGISQQTQVGSILRTKFIDTRAKFADSWSLKCSQRSTTRSEGKKFHYVICWKKHNSF